MVKKQENSFSKDKIMNIALPILLWGVVTAAYAFRRPLEMLLFSIDPYVLLLVCIPVALLLLKKVSFSEIGLKLGKPIYGIPLALFLPAILFIRFFFMGKSFVLTGDILPLIISSVAEEVFFRGYLQSQFDKSFNGNIGLSFVLTNLLFAFVHLIKGYNILGVLSVGAVGLYFSFVKDKKGGDSLGYSAAAHSLYNIVNISLR
ncbi:MAG: CPBP family intramembrane metalloprotease [Candidatus Aenigmarchaeota archaeon]|nr:CPBP family intramembrane metalloprotease [Candidatus Aenigmarchaeota archaeon]